MTIEELAETLPNGFHDAEPRTVLIDYAKPRVVIEGEIWVGDMSRVTSPREAYRKAEVVIEGLRFVAIEPPDPTYPYAKKDHLWVDLATEGVDPPLRASASLPEGSFVSSFFVQDWNAFLHVAGTHASLTWRGELKDRSAH